MMLSMRVLGIRADAFETPRLTRAMESLAEAGYETTILYWNREISAEHKRKISCLLYTSPSPRD